MPTTSGAVDRNLNVSSTIWHFVHSSAFEIDDGIILDFYTGLLRIVYTVFLRSDAGATVFFHYSFCVAAI